MERVGDTGDAAAGARRTGEEEGGALRARTRRNLLAFTALVLAIGWIGIGVDRLLDNREADSPGLALWIFTPLLASFLLRVFAGDGWKDLGLRPSLRGNGWGYLTALLVYPGIAALVLLVGGATGAIGFPGLSNGSAALLFQGSAAMLLPMFVKNIFEEFAWRGYLTPKVYALGARGLGGHAIVGAIWGLWHLPYFFHFLDRTEIERYTSLGLAAFVVFALLTMVAWAMVFGELRLLTGSIWPAVLMHMVEDAFLNELLMEGHIAVAPAWEWLFSPGVGVLSLLLFAGLGVVLYRIRVRREGG